MELPDAVGPITWQRLTAAEFPLLARWLARPHVYRWWHHDSSAQAVERDFGPAARGEESAEDLLVFLGERPVGLMQRARLSAYPDYLAEICSVVAVPAESMTLDYFLAAAADLDRGLGTAMISAFVEATFVEYDDIESIVVAVCAANVASWRALEKAGLQRVGSGPMEPDNPADDPMHHVYRLDRARAFPSTLRRATSLSGPHRCGPATAAGRAQMTGVVQLPSGISIRGRSLFRPPIEDADFLLALAPGPLPSWPHRRVSWPDFWIPTDQQDAVSALNEVITRARQGQVVEVACRGGRGRTGTAIAAIAVLDGMLATEAVSWVRRTYDPKAVEMPWQSRWVRRILG